MASCDSGRVPIECEGAIRVFGIGGQTGKVDVAGFSQLGLRRLSGIHGELKLRESVQVGSNKITE